MPTRCQPQDLSWFYQRVAVFLFFLADVFNLTEKESNQGLSWQFPPTGTAGSNQKRTRSSSKWTPMYECRNISAFTKEKPRLPYFSVCCMETKHMAWEAPIATEMTREGPKALSSSLRKFTLTGSGWTSGRPGTPSWQSLAFPHMYKSPFSAQTIKNKNISSCRLFTERKFDYLHLVNRRHDVESQ